MKKQYNGMEVFTFEVVCVIDSNWGFDKPLIVKQEAANALQAFYLVAQNYPNTLSIKEVA